MYRESCTKCADLEKTNTDLRAIINAHYKTLNSKVMKKTMKTIAVFLFIVLGLASATATATITYWGYISHFGYTAVAWTMGSILLGAFLTIVCFLAADIVGTGKAK